MSRTVWEFFSNASSELSAQKHRDQISKNLPNLEFSEIVSYHKGGFILHFSCELTAMDRPGKVYEVLKMIQDIGYGCTTSGDLDMELDCVCNRTKISGIEMIHVVVSDLNAS